MYFINSTNFIKCWLGYNSPNAKYNTCEMNSKSPYLSLSLFPPPISNPPYTQHTHSVSKLLSPLHSLQQFLKAAAATSLTTHIILYARSGLILTTVLSQLSLSSRTGLSIGLNAAASCFTQTLCHRWCHAWVGGSCILRKFLSPSQRGPLSISHRAFTRSRCRPASSTCTGASSLNLPVPGSF